MASDAVVFNLAVPGQAGAAFSYFNDEHGCSVSWVPHPDLLDGTRSRIVEAVGSIPRKWLMPPIDGELFDSKQAGEDRLLGHSLAAGFQVVGGSGSTAIRKNYLCIHHGMKTRNHRDLSELVERDPTNSRIIISTRKRDDTHSWAKGCLWRCFLVPWVEVDNSENRVERWILRYGTSQVTHLRTDRHNHVFAANPFIYPRHKKGQSWAVDAIAQATAMRDSSLSFRHAERILYGQGLKIDRKTYYNLARNKGIDLSQDGLLALVTVLEHDNWTYRTFWEWKLNDQGHVATQVLKAVFFTNNDLIRLARRFTPDWMIQMDGTFNTNRIKMPLIDCLGVSNTGHSFLFAFCFVTSESADNWGFVLQCLEMTVFPGLPLPRVILADQGMGLRAVYQSVWPDSFLQFCEWHAAENVKKRLATQRYKKEERDTIMDLVWKYLWSASFEALEANRTLMKQAMKVPEQEYVDRYWVPKESQLIRLFTAQLPNLNCFSTQRDEGQHPIVKTVLNHQLRLDEGVRKLAIEMKLASERLQEAEYKDKAHNRRLLEANVWYIMKEQVASWPLMKVLDEWKKLDSIKQDQQQLTECRCTMVQRFGLPCYHDLERAYDEVIPLPLSLVHSRWWYAAGVEERSGWKPSYSGIPTGLNLHLARPTIDIINTTNELLLFRDGLNQEKQQRLDEDHTKATRLILQQARQRQQYDTVAPQILSTPIISTWDRHAKSHDKSMKRMMTGAEAAERDANKAEEQEKQQQRAQDIARATEVAIDDELLAGIATAAEYSSESDASDINASEVNEIVFATTISPQPTTPSRKRTLTLVHRTPDKPREALIRPTTPSASVSTSDQHLYSLPTEAHEILASTAPARLDGRPRREGKNSEYNRVIAIERGRGRGGRGRA